MPYIPPRNPNNLSDPDLLRTSKRAIEQYAQEYLHVQHPTTSATKLSRSRFEYSRIESRPKRSWHPEVYVYRPRMDLCEDPDERTITAYLDLPGLKLPDVEIRLRDDILTVSGKRHAPAARYPFQELKYGAFRRSIRLPIGIQRNQASASMSDGILILSWPNDPQGLPPIQPKVGEDTLSTVVYTA